MVLFALTTLFLYSHSEGDVSFNDKLVNDWLQKEELKLESSSGEVSSEIEESEKAFNAPKQEPTQYKLVLEGPVSVSVGELVQIKPKITSFLDFRIQKKKELTSEEKKPESKSEKIWLGKSSEKKNAKKKNHVYEFQYSLVQGPEGATIDSKTGMIEWLVTQNHTSENYLFTVVATKKSNPKIRAIDTLKIKLINPLTYFGYSYFEQARMAVDARRKAIDHMLKAPRKTKKTELGEIEKPVKKKFPWSETEIEATQEEFTIQDRELDEPSVDATRNYVGPDQMLAMNVAATAPARYQLGPGDTLYVKYWSPTTMPKAKDIVINPQGMINVPVTNKSIVVRGYTLAQIEKLLEQEISKGLKEASVTVTLKELRTISITIAGEAYSAGSYQVPAVVTLFNTLYASGGPTFSGSLRNIQLKRADGTTLNFDFYRFLITGDTSQDVPLLPGDVIFIPPVETRITIKGEVRRPAIYELKTSERLDSIMNYAGGVKASGVAQRVSVDSIKPGIGKRLIDVDLNLKNLANNPILYDGDIVEILSIRPHLTNSVMLEGAVDQPSKYALTKGMRIADLIDRARGLLESAYTQKADLFRKNPDGTQTLITIHLTKALEKEPSANILLQRDDRVVVYYENDVKWMGYRYIELKGAARKPGTYYRADDLKVSDVIMQAGGLLPEAYQDQAFIQRYHENGTVADLIKIDLRRASAGDSRQNIVLHDRDILTIQTVKEAIFIPKQIVRITGAVQKPGTYTRAANMKALDLIQLAGGTLPNAADRIEVAHARVSIGALPTVLSLREILQKNELSNLSLQDGDVLTVPFDSTIVKEPRMVTLIGAVARPGSYMIIGENETLSSVIKRAGGLLDDAFAKGAQLVRNSNDFNTIAQKKITPRLTEVFGLVQKDTYIREVGLAEIEKYKVTKGEYKPNTTLPTPLLLGSLTELMKNAESENLQDTQRKIIGQISSSMNTTETGAGEKSGAEFTTVTAARKLNEQDLIPDGFIAISMASVLEKPGTSADISIREGDVIIVPKKPTTVSVIGAVVVPSAVIYEPRKSVAYYVDRSGGLTIDAAKDQMVIMRANGLVETASRRTILELGDVLFVPTDVMAKRIREHSAIQNIDSILRSIANAALSVAIVRHLTK